MTVRRAFLVLAAAAASAALIAVQDPAAASVPQAQPVWSIDTNPSAPPNGGTGGVSCPSSSFCAAVGYFAASSSNDGAKAEAWLRLSDGKWHTSTVTDNVGKQLNAVSCVSSTFCVAVAQNSQNGSSAGAYRFDGKSWTPTSLITTVPGDRVTGVSCVSTTWCLASGTRGQVFTSSPGRANDRGLRAFVGRPAAPAPTPTTARIWRYNGKQWDVGSAPTISGSASVALNGVTCRSTSFCLTAGVWNYNSRTHPWVGSFNGSKWTTSAPTVPATADTVVLRGISCPSTSECTTVGELTTSSGSGSVTHPLAATLSGGAWSTASVPDPADNSQAGLYSVSCAANGSCTAVGAPSSFEAGQKVFAVTRSGATWTQDLTPGDQDSFTIAISVSCTSPLACVAVGGRLTGSGFHEYLISKR